MSEIEILRVVTLVVFTLIALYTDIKYKKIFNTITLPFFIIGVIFSLITKDYIYIGFAIFCFVMLLFAKGIGGGDVKFIVSLPMFLGFKIVSFYLVFLVLLLVVQYILKVKKLKSLKLAPIISISILVALLI